MTKHTSIGPLQGTTVLDLTETEARRFCVTLLADLGATVARIDQGGDCRKNTDDFLSVALLRNRRAIAVDCPEQAKQTFKDQLAESEVLLVGEDSLVPGGLTSTECAEIRPALVYLARYIIRASFSQERMTYISEESKVIYQSKDGKDERVFDALEWLAAMCSHVPNKGEQIVRYYGYFSNVSRGKRKKNDQDELIPSILGPNGSSKEYCKNWARLIQKIYEVDPLLKFPRFPALLA